MSALLATWRAALAEVWVNRSAFGLQLGIMITNDLIWLFFWNVFFSRAGGLDGWHLQQVLVLFSIATATFGITSGMFGNCLRITEMAANGELDSTLTMPVDPLSHLLVRKVVPLNLGDLVFGTSLFLIAGHPTPDRLAKWIAVVLLGSAVQTAFVVIVSALSMMLRGRGDHPRLAFDMLSIVSFYPVGIFGGLAKVLTFTVLPAAFVTGIPSRLLVEFSWFDLGVLTMVAIGTALAARVAFQLALRGYRSGSQFTSA